MAGFSFFGRTKSIALETGRKLQGNGTSIAELKVLSMDEMSPDRRRW
jgi:hypothetical protein